MNEVAVVTDKMMNTVVVVVLLMDVNDTMMNTVVVVVLLMVAELAYCFIA